MKIHNLLSALLVLTACSNNVIQEETPKILSIGGTTTETLAALGLMDQIVAVDITSTYPESIAEKQNVGHVSQIKVETILAIPGLTHVVVQEGLLPEAIKSKLDGIEILSVPLEFTTQGAKHFISQLGKAFEKTATADEINQKISSDLALLPKVTADCNLLFLYGRGAGAISAAGKQTIQNAYIEIIGATNACAAFDGFKLLSPEVLAASSPSHILLFDHTYELLGGAEGIAAIPGIRATAAGINTNYIVLESSLLGNFGPRLGEAALAISQSVQ